MQLHVLPEPQCCQSIRGMLLVERAAVLLYDQQEKYPETLVIFSA